MVAARKAPGCDLEHTASRECAVPAAEMPTAPSVLGRRGGWSVTRRSAGGLGSGEGGLGGLVDDEHLRESGDPEDLEQAVLVADQLERAVVGTDLLQAAHQDAEPGGVEELDLLHVDQDVVGAGGDELGDLVAQLRGGVDVDL